MMRLLSAFCLLVGVCVAESAAAGEPAASVEPLPGTQPLTWTDDLASRLVDGADRFLLRKLEASIGERAKHWQRDFTSPEAYQKSIEPNRKRLAHILGVRDERLAGDGPDIVAGPGQPTEVGRGPGYKIFAVRWPVMRLIHGEGLLLIPDGKTPAARVVAIPDADQTPEMICGLTDGVPAASPYARRLAENGVRYVQLFDWGWDFHGTGPGEDIRDGLTKKCATMDKPVAALIRDLKERGMLDDTLIVWGGEFGRTPFREGRTAGGNILGRDHYPDCYTMWLAGGGVKRGFSYGETDELGFSITRDQVHVHDLQATILHLLGFNHERLTFRFQGRDYRLTDVHGNVVKELLA